jgi:hypothetical protein
MANFYSMMVKYYATVNVIEIVLCPKYVAKIILPFVYNIGQCRINMLLGRNILIIGIMISNHADMLMINAKNLLMFLSVHASVLYIRGKSRHIKSKNSFIPFLTGS